MNAATPRAVAPWIFTLLIAPFGMQSGFLGVTLAYQLGEAKVSTEAIASLIAVSYLPQTWKFFWAPVVDLTWTRRGWYFSSLVVSVAGVVAMGWYGADGRAMGALTVAGGQHHPAFVVEGDFCCAAEHDRLGLRGPFAPTSSHLPPL